MSVPEITIDFRKKCRKCAQAGVVGKTGLCMRCAGKEIRGLLRQRRALGPGPGQPSKENK